AEGILHRYQDCPADHGLPAGLGREFCLDDQGSVLDIPDALALEGFDKVRGQFRIGGNVLPHLFQEPADPFDVGVARYTESELLDRPIATVVLDLADLAVWHRRYRSAGIAQRHGSDRNLLHGSLRAGSFDIFAETERIVYQEEKTGNDILDQRLRTE